MAKKYFTSKREESLRGLLSKANSPQVRGNRAIIPESIVMDLAQTSWNDYQKIQKSLKQRIKTQPWEMKPIHEQQARGVVYQFNKIIDEQNLQMRKISFEDIKNSSKNWNSFQSTMAAYRNLTKKGATSIVGYNDAGLPIYKWEQDIVNTRLKKINMEREKLRSDIQSQKYQGIILSEEYFSLQPKDSPLKGIKNKTEIGYGIRSIIAQSTPGYLERREQQYYDNFISSLNYLDNNELKLELFKIIQTISPKELYAAGTADALLSIGFIYSIHSEYNTYDQRGNIVLEKLKEYAKKT